MNLAEPRVRSALTLVTLVMIVGLGARWGWSAATKPIPEQTDAPIVSLCRTKNVAAGDKIRPADVVVSVFNGSSRAGLAQRTLGQFVDQGFGQGEAGNAPANAGVQKAEIWTANPKDPAVQLVASRLKGVKVIEGSALGSGVVVVVGDQFDDLAKGAPFVTAEGNAEICAPGAAAKSP
ncbi:MAG: LytR C-terminal domain-containing protein [Nocardioides sp.]